MKPVAILLSVAMLAAAGWAYRSHLQPESQQRANEQRKAPVEVAPVVSGSLELRRTWSGTLTADAQFQVAPKVSGRVVKVAVDVADPVHRGQVVATLDAAEYEQAVTQAEADLAVAEANLAEAKSAQVIAQRALERMTQMHERGVASASQLDLVKAEELGKRAAITVAEARVTRAQASLEGAKIRLGYTQVRAEWSGGGAQRVVAERFVDPGDTVAANGALLSIVQTAPITAVLFVTERDYGRLERGQQAQLTTDAFPGRTFTGTITRISPVFRAASRQARVELRVENPKDELKPGMFVRAKVTLRRVEGATIVPVAAIVRRGGETGVFVLAGEKVAWRSVTLGVRQGERVEVLGGSPLSGEVVTLGQQLIGDGSAVRVPKPKGPRPAKPEGSQAAGSPTAGAQPAGTPAS